MGKILSTILFIGLCGIVFITSAVISFQVYLKNKVEAPYKYMKVKFDDSVGKVYKDLDSDGKETTKYDLYVPANADKNKDYSLIFYIHGGGFTGGDKADGKYWCPYFVSKEYVCASVNYTLQTKEHASNLNLMYDELRITAQKIKEKSVELGFNLTEMATTGGSAGGCLALLYAYRNPETSPLPVKFVFEQTGPVLFEPDGWGQTTNKGRADFVNLMTGKNFGEGDVGSEEYQNAIKEISPALLVNENTIPTIMGYGPNDKVVPTNLKYSLIDKLKENNIKYDYIDFANSGHGLLDDLDKSEEFYKKVEEYLEMYFENK